MMQIFKILICFFGALILSVSTILGTNHSKKINGVDKLSSFYDSDVNKNKESEYKTVGMPVGGLYAGQVYLGSDGDLWYWDIFNVPRIDPGGTGDKYYNTPLMQTEDIDQGFAIKIVSKGKEYYREISRKGFQDIKFSAEYPLGKVDYVDKKLPVSIHLDAFSPFVPTNVESSDYPAIVLEYTVQNTTNHKVSVTMLGWLENANLMYSEEKAKGTRNNDIVCENGITQLNLGATLENCSFPDAGNMTLAYDGVAGGIANINSSELEEKFSSNKQKLSKVDVQNTLVGGLESDATLAPNEKRVFRYVISWYYPNVNLNPAAPAWLGKESLRHYYSSKFRSSSDVALHTLNHNEILEDTKQWNRTWYNSTMPKWFLTRTFINTSTLATTGCVRFYDQRNIPFNQGRFYTWEGVYLGDGTCTHVFHYEQALGRVFPHLSRQLREQVDFGLAYEVNGAIDYRAEFSNEGHHPSDMRYAMDGQAGTILRSYREYLTSVDNSFLLKNWYKIKTAMQLMIESDIDKNGNCDGIIEGAQYNTLDKTWYGKNSWISGLYVSALEAASKMANEVEDTSFANRCKAIAERGRRNVTKNLFNGEYFIQKLDPNHLEAVNSNNGSHLNNVLGEYWAKQLLLSGMSDSAHINKSLDAIMKYNFVDHYGEYLKNAKIPISRRYAQDDESGLIVCSFPKGGAEKASGGSATDWDALVVGYFSEMMTGFSHTIAALLMDYNRPYEALKVEKAIDNRYNYTKRNPYNEIEYGNHYTRAMSSYGVYNSACGYFYNGPKGIMQWDPKIQANDFKSAFIAAEGWGTYTQKLDKEKNEYLLDLAYGKLVLNDFRIQNDMCSNIKVMLNGKEVAYSEHIVLSKFKDIEFKNAIHLNKGDHLLIVTK